MTHFLKHTALRLWASIALGVPPILAILPALQSRVGLEWAPVAAALVMAVAFGFTGWVFNRLGLVLADGRIREAGICERAGSMDAAQKAYAEAAAVFDSFLISPRIRRRRSDRLTSRLVRFHLSRGDGNGHGREMVTDYVRSHPHDREVAEAWLRRTAGSSSLDPGEQEAALAIADALGEHPGIQKSLATLYLAARRTDFAALAAYQRVFDPQGEGDEAMAASLAGLFVQEGRVDDWALALYIRTFSATKAVDCLRGVAACVHWLQETAANARDLGTGRRLIAKFDAHQLAGMRAGFVPPETEEQAPGRKTGWTLKTAAGTARRAAAMTLTVLGRITAGGADAARSAVKGIEQVGRSPRARRAMIWSGAALAGAGALFFLINTAGHLLQPRTRTALAPTPAPVPVTDKFTIQVAAYLKKAHAEKFVRALRENKIDAYWAEASGKNKRWFQVRVHHFPDKASARAYGESLKAKGIIDDFYVANYIRH